MESPALLTLAEHPTTAPPLATYGAVLGSRHVVRLLGGTLIGRLPNSMVPVGLVLWITGDGGLWPSPECSPPSTGWRPGCPSRSRAG